jgi:hypothetical protein
MLAAYFCSNARKNAKDTDRSLLTGRHGNDGRCIALHFHRLTKEDIMGFGRGALLWLLGVPLPIILLLALFMHH